MNKYIVKKELLDPYCNLLKVGDSPDYTEGNVVASNFLASAIEHGFIEEVESKHWRANGFSNYYRINSKTNVIVAPNGTSSGKSDELYELGNYFKSQETAELVAEALKQLFEYLHDRNKFPLAAEPSELTEAIDRARNAVLKDDGVSYE